MALRSPGQQKKSIFKKVFGAVVFISVFILVCALFEVLFWSIQPADQYTKHQPKSVLRYHPVLGYQINADGRYETSYYFLDDRLPIKTEARLRSGRRYTPVQNNNREKFALFFGDSFVFGVGVNDDETLPYYFGRQAPEYRPYNYGVPGGSVQNMYYKLASEDLTEQVGESSGIAIYWFFGFHTNRVIGGMPGFNKWADKTACYEIENNHLEYKGNFREAHPYRAIVYDLLHFSNTCRYAKFNLPLVLRPKHFELTVFMLMDSIRRFKSQFPDGEFIIMFWDDRVPYLPVKERVEAQGIRTLLVREFFNGIDNPVELPELLPDGHLVGRDYKCVAEGLLARL